MLSVGSAATTPPAAAAKHASSATGAIQGLATRLAVIRDTALSRRAGPGRSSVASSTAHTIPPDPQGNPSPPTGAPPATDRPIRPKPPAGAGSEPRLWIWRDD
ncbi:hypothetical protein GCM10027447_24480 [Glycomyces halotolerans]